MQISVGSKFGPYEIVAPLGAGGMGEVYRAKDTRLKREVAIKILSDQALLDPERQQRFQREAQAVSALNHPNILAVHDVGSENGTSYMVSELVDGESLGQVVQKGPIPIRNLLDIAVQIADGLAAAHQSGITHRDLKPENIMVSRNARVKILDFGLAKLHPEMGEEDVETVSRGLTNAGIILGTVHYMSPEQASGKKIDFRSDQFSFGLILYEMATGKKAFSRNSAPETLAAIINEEPPTISSVNPKIPVPLRWLTDRCLAKDPRQRYHSTLDLYHELRNLRDHLSETTAADVVAPVQKKRLWLNRITLGLFLLGASLAGAILVLFIIRSPGVDLSAYRMTPVATEDRVEDGPSWSPDGTSLAYYADVNGVLQIFTRSLKAPISTQITKSANDCVYPIWSSDGSRILYTSNSNEKPAIWSVGAAGGTPELIFQDVLIQNAQTTTISPDGKTIAFARITEDTQALWIATNGGSPQQYTEKPFSDVQFGTALPRFAPDGSKILIVISPRNASRAEFWIVPYPKGKPYRVLESVTHYNNLTFNWMPDSQKIVFTGPIQGTPGAHMFIADLRNDSSRAITINDRLEQEPAVSPDGKKIAYQQLEENWDLVAIPVDGSPIETLFSTSRDEFSPSWSPVGNQYAYSKGIWGEHGIWLRNQDEEWERPIVMLDDFGQVAEELSYPTFSPDGRWIAYFSMAKERYGIWLSAVAGGQPVWLSDGHYPCWSPDGNWIAFVMYTPKETVLAKMKVGGSGNPIILSHDLTPFTLPQWSKEGISCETSEGLFLIPPDGQNRRLLSKEIPIIHGWNKDGSGLYLLRRNEKRHLILSSMDLQTNREKVITDLGPLPHTTSFRGFSLSPDGKSFATSISRKRSDIWILEGFNIQPGFWEKLFKKYPRKT